MLSSNVAANNIGSDMKKKVEMLRSGTGDELKDKQWEIGKEREKKFVIEFTAS